METPFPGPEILQCSVPGPYRGLVSVGTHVPGPENSASYRSNVKKFGYCCDGHTVRVWRGAAKTPVFSLWPEFQWGQEFLSRVQIKCRELVAPAFHWWSWFLCRKVMNYDDAFLRNFVSCHFLICEQYICTWSGAGDPVANTGAWQLNKGGP